MIYLLCCLGKAMRKRHSAQMVSCQTWTIRFKPPFFA